MYLLDLTSHLGFLQLQQPFRFSRCFFEAYEPLSSSSKKLSSISVSILSFFFA